MNKDWHESVSQPRYETAIEKDIFVSMRDGVRIAVDIYRPNNTNGKFPALLGMSPYSKDLQKLPIFEFPTDRELGNGGIEAGDSDYFVSRGYVHVIADVRGTGISEGSYRIFTTKEQEDGYELIEWIARQPWCDGNVGMLGMSYFGMIQLLVAAQNPPHLKAIFPVDAATDMYRHWSYHGGILHKYVSGFWDGSLVVNSSDAADLPEEEWKGIAGALMLHPDIRSYPRAIKTLKWPSTNPHLFDVLVHPFDGPFYLERSAYTRFGKINVPCYLLYRWTAPYLHLPGAFQAFENIKSPRKLMMTIPESGVGFNRPWHENHDIVLRWYDHWLKDIDTGIMDEPAISILVQGRNQWRHENEWPLARTDWTKWYLGSSGRLTLSQPGWNEPPDRFTNAIGLKPGETVPGIRYTADSAPDDLEITGPLALYLHASISTPDTNWIAEVNDLDEDGTVNRVSIGWLKASHWEVDARRSKPYKPFHPHDKALAIKPGKMIRYDIEIRETSYVIKAGHRLQLLIKAQDAPWEGKSYIYRLSQHLSASMETLHTIYHTPEYPSHLLLPVISNRKMAG